MSERPIRKKDDLGDLLEAVRLIQQPTGAMRREDLILCDESAEALRRTFPESPPELDVDWRERAQRAEAEAARYREALTKIGRLWPLDPCESSTGRLEYGADIARAALRESEEA